MSTYVISDIHGEYDKLMDIIGQIDLKAEEQSSAFFGVTKMDSVGHIS